MSAILKVVCGAVLLSLVGCATKPPPIPPKPPEQVEAEKQKIADAKNKLPSPVPASMYVDFGVVLYEKSPPRGLYLIKDSVKRNPSTNRATGKLVANFSEARIHMDQAFLSEITTMEFDCNGIRAFRVNTIEFFPKYFGKGKGFGYTNLAEQGDAKWNSIQPDTTIQRVGRSVCHIGESKTPTKTSAEETDTDKYKYIADAIYVKEISEKVRLNVITPPGTPTGIKNTFGVTQLSNGEVIEVVLIKSSGRPELDKAVARAIWKASPLPLPKDGDVAKLLRLTYTS